MDPGLQKRLKKVEDITKPSKSYLSNNLKSSLFLGIIEYSYHKCSFCDTCKPCIKPVVKFPQVLLLDAKGPTYQ